MTSHVAIATTQGPVFIQDITQEEAGVSPMVCLNGTSKQLAISNAYADFVKKGSGLIERDFGSASWRMDVSGAIDAGDSWQLGVYVAHMLHQENRLGNGMVESGDEVILVTGAVKYSGEVTPVSQIAEKMRAAGELGETWRKQGASVTLLMHPENMAQAITPTIETSDKNAIVNVNELTGGKSAGGDRSYALPMVFAALAIIAGVIVLFPEEKETSPFPESAIRELPASPDATANLEVLTAAEPFLCQTDQMRLVILTVGPEGYFKSTGMSKLCGINLRTSTSANSHASLYALDSGALVTLSPTMGSEQAGWQIPLPVNADSPRPYVVIVSTDRFSPDIAMQLKSHLDENRPFGTDPIQEILAILNDMSLDAAVFGHTLR